jgi:hypothetical protein
VGRLGFQGFGGGLLHSRLHLWVQEVKVIVRGNAHPQPTQLLSEGGCVVRHRDRDGAGVQRIIPRDDLEHQSAIPDRTVEGADVVTVKAGGQQPAV